MSIFLLRAGHVETSIVVVCSSDLSVVFHLVRSDHSIRSGQSGRCCSPEETRGLVGIDLFVRFSRVHLGFESNDCR